MNTTLIIRKAPDLQILFILVSIIAQQVILLRESYFFIVTNIIPYLTGVVKNSIRYH